LAQRHKVRVIEIFGISPCSFNPTPIPSSAAAEGGLALMSLVDSGYEIPKKNTKSSPPSAAAEEGMGVGLNGQGEIPNNLDYNKV